MPDIRYEQRLGPRPQTSPSRGLCDHAAQLLDDYRTRWNITDDPPSLGRTPTRGSEQANDRRSLESQLRRLEQLLSRDGDPPGLEH